MNIDLFNNIFNNLHSIDWTIPLETGGGLVALAVFLKILKDRTKKQLFPSSEFVSHEETSKPNNIDIPPILELLSSSTIINEAIAYDSIGNKEKACSSLKEALKYTNNLHERTRIQIIINKYIKNTSTLQFLVDDHPTLENFNFNDRVTSNIEEDLQNMMNQSIVADLELEKSNNEDTNNFFSEFGEIIQHAPSNKEEKMLVIPIDNSTTEFWQPFSEMVLQIQEEVQENKRLELHINPKKNSDDDFWGDFNHMVLDLHNNKNLQK